jgi:hypothetical protein
MRTSVAWTKPTTGGICSGRDNQYAPSPEQPLILFDSRLLRGFGSAQPLP